MIKSILDRMLFHIRNKGILSLFLTVNKNIYRTFIKPDLVYAPHGWKTKLTGGKVMGWNAPGVVAAEVAKWNAFCDVTKGTGPLGFYHGHTDLSVNRDISFHNMHMTYGYVLALAAHQKSRLSILDYGGSLGHYYQIGKALLPDVAFEFHCKEVPSIAEIGKSLNPEILWHIDDSCLERTYDLVMLNALLQCIENWKELLQKVSAAVGEYLLLTDVPVVEKSDSFVAVQRAYGTQMLHWQFNKDDFLQVVKNTKLHLLREFVTGGRVYIKNAPEQFEYCGWLLKREKLSSSQGDD